MDSFYKSLIGLPPILMGIFLLGISLPTQNSGAAFSGIGLISAGIILSLAFRYEEKLHKFIQLLISRD